MKKTTLVIAFAALTAISMALTGCNSSNGSTATDGTTEITFIGADPAEAFAPLIAAFEDENPDITVNYQNVPFDQYNNVVQQRVGSKDASIDVLLVDAGAVASM